MKLQNNDIIAAYLGAQTISDINLGDNNVFSNYYGVSFPLEYSYDQNRLYALA